MTLNLYRACSCIILRALVLGNVDDCSCIRLRKQHCFLTNNGNFIFFCVRFGFGYWRLKGLSSTPGKSVAKVARLLGENRHQLKQHRDYSGREEVILALNAGTFNISYRDNSVTTWRRGTL